MLNTNLVACPLPDFAVSDAQKLSIAFSKLRPLTRDGTDGRVYGGDPNLIHSADGTRAGTGNALASRLSEDLRRSAYGRGDRTREEALSQPLCPGCYMVIGFNMLRELAVCNGQPLEELGRTMAAAFQELANNPELGMESIDVLLDGEDA